MSPKVCRCHGLPMRKYPRQYACRVKKLVAERVTARRYRRTAKGRAVVAHHNARRVRIGRRTVARMDTPAQAAAINARIVQQITAFTAQQRKEMDAALTR